MSGPVSPARAAAFDILRRVEEDGAYASVLLAGDGLDLSPQDRSLTYELVLGTLRWQLWLDAALAHFAGRPIEKLDPPVLRALRLGLFQLRFLTRIPESAAVNESVNLVHSARLRSATGLANAVLRRALRERRFDPAEAIPDPIEQLSVETSHPVWMLSRWSEAFGFDQARALATANNDNPISAFRFTSQAGNREALLAEFSEIGVDWAPSPIAPFAWRLVSGGSKLRDYVSRGLIYFQDEASQWVANLAGTKYGPLATELPVLDVCGAPGSKATLIADRLAPEGSVVAGDLYGHRLETVRQAAKRMSVNNLSVVGYDAVDALPFADGSFGAVLLDAPCSGTGTLRRNPEIRWRISPDDLDDLLRKQRRLLGNAAKTVAPGGMLFYSTCSVEREENESVIYEFLQDSTEFRGVDLREISNIGASGPDLDASAPFQGRFWPQKHGTEGFFVAALVRNNE